jgi:hypothetical protein
MQLSVGVDLARIVKNSQLLKGKAKKRVIDTLNYKKSLLFDKKSKKRRTLSMHLLM